MLYLVKFTMKTCVIKMASIVLPPDENKRRETALAMPFNPIMKQRKSHSKRFKGSCVKYLPAFYYSLKFILHNYCSQQLNLCDTKTMRTKRNKRTSRNVGTFHRALAQHMSTTRLLESLNIIHVACA